MRIVLGLGNPGAQHAATRHNLGFRVLDEVAARVGARFQSAGPEGRLAWYAPAEVGRVSCLLVKPRTYMNRAGRAARAFCELHGEPPDRLVVVHDEADLALGSLRLRRGGGSGGHNGIRSVTEVVQSADFYRVRLGVRGRGRDEEDLADYVLRPFEDDELETVERMVLRAGSALEVLLAEGLEAAMRQFHGRLGTELDGC
jgi:PTH1 family peptidyl-tRNA hydrolase